MAKEAEDSAQLVILIISDGKPGHLNQSLGLAEALDRATPCAIHVRPALPLWQALIAGLSTRLPQGFPPAPDLILGAGHATHSSLLALRRITQGRAVVLMKPSLPRCWFDLCILPRHDGIPADAHTLVTEGAINRVRPNQVPSEARSQRGLLLIGGPSPHFDWNEDSLHVQIQSLLTRTPEIAWSLTPSRRTPPDFFANLPSFSNLTFVTDAAATPDWLPMQLGASGIVWVTPDSVSMVFEALTAGANVGVFDLAARPGSRVALAITDLADARRITRFSTWCANSTLHPNLHPLAEADRCAEWILEWLKNNKKES